MRYRLIRDHAEGMPLRWACSAVGVSESGFRGWCRRAESPRKRADRRMLVEVRASFKASLRTYGSPRVTKDLQELGYRINVKRVARLMRENGLQAIQRRRFKATTHSGHDFPVTPNVLERQFDTDGPDSAWVADTTYISTEEGWLFLATVMDLFGRRIVGWNTSGRNDRFLVLAALERARRLRDPRPGLIHHSDRGSQYAAYEYQQRLDRAGVTSSMSRKGNCYDNAAMESFFSSLKRERVHRRKYWSREEATADIGDYIDEFYNPKRRHSTLGGLSPIQYEMQANLT